MKFINTTNSTIYYRFFFDKEESGSGILPKDEEDILPDDCTIQITKIVVV